MADPRPITKVGVAHDPSRAASIAGAYEGDEGIDALLREALIGSGLGPERTGPILSALVKKARASLSSRTGSTTATRRRPGSSA